MKRAEGGAGGGRGRGGPSGSGPRTGAAPWGLPVGALSSWQALALGPQALLLWEVMGGAHLTRAVGSHARCAERAWASRTANPGGPAADPWAPWGRVVHLPCVSSVRACHGLLGSAGVASEVGTQ